MGDGNGHNLKLNASINMKKRNNFSLKNIFFLTLSYTKLAILMAKNILGILGSKIF